MATVIGERIARRMRELGLTQTKLAERVGVSQPSIGRLINGETRETGKLAELASALETTAEYLVGTSDQAEPGPGESARRSHLQMIAPQFDPDLVELAEIDLRFGLGGTYLDVPVVETKRTFSRSWLRQFSRAAPDQLFWAMGYGDSMEPTIRSGEVILIDRSEVSAVGGDGIWAFTWGEIGMVKRLRPRPEGTVDIQSDNPLVSMTTVSGEEIHIIGRVVAVVRRL